MVRDSPWVEEGGDLISRLICDVIDQQIVFLRKAKVILCLQGIIFSSCPGPDCAATTDWTG
jgi:hypothetical protein